MGSYKEKLGILSLMTDHRKKKYGLPRPSGGLICILYTQHIISIITL